MENKLLSEVIFDITWEFAYYFQVHNELTYDSRHLFESIYEWAIWFEKWLEEQYELEEQNKLDRQIDYLEEVIKFAHQKIQEYLLDYNV